MARSELPAIGTLLFLVLGFGSPCGAQTGSTGSIEGVALDPTGTAVARSRVSVRQLETGGTASTETNAVGLFRFPALPVGRYRLRAQFPGFATIVFESIELGVGARLNLRLAFRMADRSADVVVHGDVPLIETSRTGMSTTIGERSLTSLPVNGRDFTSFALLVPGISTDARGGLSVSGQRAMNSLLVDGASADDEFWGQPIGGEGFPVVLGQSGYHVSLEAVQEFQVQTNAYSAEFGRAGGGVVNTVTKSGTNDFHGDAFEFYRDKSLNANSAVNEALGLPKDPFHFNQFGGVLGGPLARNRLFFLVGYDGLRSNVANGVALGLPPGFHLSSDPVTAGFERRALDYLQDRARSWSVPVRQDDWLAKVDWLATPAHTVNARWVRQRSQSVFPGFAQQSLENASPTGLRVDVAAASLTSTVSPSTVNVVRVSYFTNDAPFDGVAASPQADVFEQGRRVLRVGRAAGAPQEMRSHRLQFSDSLSWLRGHHMFKAGLDVLIDHITYYAAQNFAGSYRFLSLAGFGASLAGTPDPRRGETFLQAFSNSGTPGVTTHPDTSGYAAFVQDEWRPFAELTLNAGLRYDLQVMGRPPVKNTSAELAAAGLDTSYRPLDASDLAPRLGLAWSPHGSDRRVVRVGYGRFYAPTPSVMAARAHFLNGVSVQPRAFAGGTPDDTWIPAYPDTICGPLDPSAIAPRCAPPIAGASAPILMFFSPAYREPSTDQASAGGELAIGPDLTVGVGYLFAKGTHLQWVRDVNLAAPTTPSTIGVANTTTRLGYQKYTLPRPLASFDRISLFDSNARSAYHALAVLLSKRFSHGYQFLASYTLGRTIDDNPNVYALNPGGGDAQLLSDPLDPGADRSVSVNDQRHRLVLSGTWQWPRAGGLPQVARTVLGGWDVSGLVTAQSGRRYSALVDADLNNDGNFQTDRTPGLSRNAFRMPALVSLDVRLSRTARVGRHSRLQFIAEAFNLFNRSNVTEVNTTQYSVTSVQAACGVAEVPCLVPNDSGLLAFGTPVRTAGPRIVQFGLKALF